MSLRDVLETIADQARWAHTHGYWKAGHGLTAEHGIDLSRTQAQRDAGPVYDLEIGDHRARTAYQDACTLVADIDRRLHDTNAPRMATQPPPVRLLPTSPPSLLADACQLAARRADHCTNIPNHCHRLADQALTALTRALGPADLAVDNGADRGVATIHRCRICGWRRLNPKLGGRCSTCHKWLRRHGTERPAHLDGISPREAQAKRLARNEGWGAA